MKSKAYTPLNIEDKDFYNEFYRKHGVQCSDYCFSVIHTWLKFAGPVEVSSISKDLLILRYKDILDDESPSVNYTLIGSVDDIEESVVMYLCDILKKDSQKIIITQPHVEKIRSKLPRGAKLNAEEGLFDYIYSVDEYADLQKPAYRRIRREINVHNRIHPDVHPEIRDIDLGLQKSIRHLINTHHTWDDTFKYENDPERDEGLVLNMGLRYAKELGLSAAGYYAHNQLCGFFLYTMVDMPDGTYADVHHARFSYEYKYMNDYAFHLLAKNLKEKDIKYINFERDADIPGLRKHKQMLKPVKMIKNYSLSLV